MFNTAVRKDVAAGYSYVFASLLFIMLKNSEFIFMLRTMMMMMMTLVAAAVIAFYNNFCMALEFMCGYEKQTSI